MLRDLYIKNSQLPLRYQKEIPLTVSALDIDAFNALDAIRTNIDTFVAEGNNLLLCSQNVGNGKSTWMSKLLKEYINRVSKYAHPNNCPALFLNINNFLNDKKLAMNDSNLMNHIIETEKNIFSAKLVVFDDLCVKNLSEFDMNNLYRWIDYRTSNCLSTMYTSNLLPEQLRQSLDERIYSRLVNYSKVIIIKDGDHRKNRKVGD